jgi:hypothetical protein
MAYRYVITWRAPGAEPYFFRGDGRYEIYLPYISTTHVSPGWVKDVAYARIFDSFPEFNEKSCSKHFIADRMKVYPYEEDILPTQIILPRTRPKRGRYPFKP